jgi:two-component system sensor histidine kinase/response regulator
LGALAIINLTPKSNNLSQPIITHQYLTSFSHDKNEPEEINSVITENSVQVLDSLEGINVLLVEDNRINTVVATQMLNAIGVDVTVVKNGQEAVNTLANASADNSFTLVLMDCQMPIMDGYQATNDIRTGKTGVKYKDIPIIAMTANTMVGDDKKCFTIGMSDYLTKPIDMDKLSGMLIKWGENKHEGLLN